MARERSPESSPIMVEINCSEIYHSSIVYLHNHDSLYRVCKSQEIISHPSIDGLYRMPGFDRSLISQTSGLDCTGFCWTTQNMSTMSQIKYSKYLSIVPTKYIHNILRNLGHGRQNLNMNKYIWLVFPQMSLLTKPSWVKWNATFKTLSSDFR